MCANIAVQSPRLFYQSPPERWPGAQRAVGWAVESNAHVAQHYQARGVLWQPHHPQVADCFTTTSE